MTDLKPSPTPVDLHDVDPPVTGPAEEATDQTADDRSLLARIRSHLPDNFKAEAEGRGIDWVVFGVVALLAVGFVLWGFLGTDSLATASTNALGTLIGATGWAFVLTASLFVVFVLWLALGKFGSIPLGQDGEKPAFKTWSWISMMFAAGMGIGLMFYGVAEPLYHYVSPPPGTVDGQTPAAIQTAMATSLFHWTLHPWAMYAVVGLAMAYGTYRMGRRQLLSDIFTPLFGRKAVDGAGGKVINILAIFATLFGSAASLGLGAIQIGGGLEANGVISAPSRAVYVVIIAILTVCFVASAVSGIERGIQWLSNTNMVLAILLALLVFVVGPTIFILNMIPSALGDYIRDLPDMSARTAATGDAETTAWLASWTIFYWAWWVSWTPFVGMFIARISAAARSASSSPACCWSPASCRCCGSRSSAARPSACRSRRPRPAGPRPWSRRSTGRRASPSTARSTTSSTPSACLPCSRRSRSSWSWSSSGSSSSPAPTRRRSSWARSRPTASRSRASR